MGYSTFSTQRSTADSAQSRQVTVYKKSDTAGFVLAGATVTSQTSTFVDVPVAGQVSAVTAVSGAGGPTITSITYLDSENQESAAVAASTAGGNIRITGAGFSSSDTVYINNLPATKTFVNATTMFANVSSGTTGNITLAIFNTANVGSLSNSAVRLSGAPAWVTAAALTAYNSIAANIALSSTTDTTVTYSLKAGSGSLPAGISLNSAGYLAGTPTGYTQDTVVTFTLLVTDTEDQAAQRTFNFTVFIGDTYFRQTTLLLQGDVGTTFISDASTNNFLVSRVGDTRPSRFSPYWPGGWSGYFDGTGDYLSIAHSTLINLSSGDFTVEGWFYCTVLTASSQQILNKDGTYNASYPSYSVYITSAGVLTVDMGNGGGTSPTSTTYTGSSVTLNTWNHFALVKSGTTIRIYQNGLQTLSTSQGLSIIDGGKALLVGYQTGQPSGQYFNGYISNIRILKGTAQYTANFTPSTTSLTTVANTSLLTLRDSILSDDSPYNATITRNGDAKLTTFSPFNTSPHTITANSYSVYFDGSGDYLSVSSSTDLEFTGDLTIECWLYPTVFNTYNYWYAMSGGSGALKAMYGNGAILIGIYGGSDLSFSGNLILNAWSHIAITRQSGTWRGFINGVLGGSNNTALSIPTGRSTLIGTSPVGDWNATGYISNFRIIKGTAQYTANFTPSTTALTAISGTSLLACQSTTIRDNSTNNFTITVNGDARPSTVNPFGETVTTISNYTWTANSYGSSGYFDGTGDYLSAPANAAFAFGSGDFTIECYVYLTVSQTQYAAIVCNINNPDGWFLSFGASNVITFSNYATTAITSSSSVAIGAWTHVAITRSGTSLKMFFNGIQVGSATNSTTYGSASSATYIGFNSQTHYFTGYITDVRVLKGTALYTGPFISPAAPVSNVANVSLLTLQSDIGSNSAQFLDQSPNNHLITRSGNTSQGSFSPLNPTAWSAYFDGSGDYLSASANSVFDITGDFTIEAWVYFTALPGTNVGNTRVASIAGYSNGSTANAGWEFYVDFTYNTFSMASWGTGNQAQCSFTPALNTWYHFSATKSGSTSRLFINGINQTLTVNTLTINNGSSPTLNIGRSSSNTQYFHYVPGYISNFRIVKGTALYTANFTPATTTLSSVANTSLLCLNSPTLTDNGPNNFTITRNGDTRITPFGPFSPHTVAPNGYSVYFDGTGDYLTAPSNAAFAFGTGVYSVEAWVYIIGSNTDNNLFCNDTTNGFDLYFQYSTNTTRLEFRGGSNIIAFNAIPTRNTWAHVALVREGTSTNQTKLYINGSLQGTGTDATNWTVNGPMLIGGIVGAAYLHGYVSNARIIKGTALYTSTFAVPAETLTAVANTSILTCHTTTLIDGSTNAFAITQNGDARPRTLNPFGETKTVGTPYVASTYGGSAYFDGTGDYLTVAGGIPSGASTEFTLECWIYLSNLSDNRVIIRGTTSNTLELAIQTNGSVKLDNTSVTPICATPASVVTANNWHHIALVRTSTNIYSIYVDGVVKISSSAYNTSMTESTTIGYSSYSATQNFVGYMSGFRVLKNKALYTSNFVPPAGPALPTTANTSLLLNFTTSGVTDSSGRNVVESVADARVVTSIKKYSSGSYYFDGTGDYMYVMGTSTELAFGTGDFTIEFWMYTSNAAQTTTLIDFRPANTNGVYICLYIISNGIRLYVSSSDRITGGTLVNNTWHHIALARSGTSTKLFLDGVQVGSTYTDSNSYLNGASRPIIGINGYDLLNPYLGYIDDVRITRGYARYTANFTPPTDRHVPQ